jgi:hypothetical protein
MTWFSAAGDYDPRALKQSINLAGVVMLAGVALSSAGDGRLVGKCPFHEDEHESFAVWQWEDGDGAWTCGCWACSPFEGRSGGTRSNGDVFDFLQALYGLTFGQAVERVLELKDEVLPTEPQAAVSLGPTPDLGRALAAASGPSNRSGLLPQLLADRGVNVPATWLYDSWLVADGAGEVLIPHYNAEGTLTAVKHRSSEDGWAGRSMRGSRLEALYGVWRARGGRARPVVLCEGESDTWTVSWLLDGEPVDVVGLPSGASAGIKDAWLDFVAGRSLTLLLDADRAGREGAGRWAAAAVGRAGDVRIASLPDGTDATSAGHDIVMKALDEAWPVIDLKSLPIYAKDGRYFRHGKITEDKETGEETEAVTIVSDFVLDPHRLVTMDDGGIVFECEVPGRQGVQRLTDAELAGVDRMRRWAAARMLSWKGTPRDLSDLLELLKAQSILIPRFRGTDVIGLHGNVFVLPDSSIGASGWGYVPPENDIDLGHSIKLDGTGWDRALPGQLARLHDPKVITPILGWIAAAPLRSIVTKFPVLGITGGSGFGKTTLLETVLGAFGFWTTTPTTLTGATAHGIQSYAGSTNSFPIWIDEYRPGARIDAKLALDQIIRDSWDGSSTIKGGMSENRMKIAKLPARAPLVVTGEDSFSETSHSERMVIIPMPKDGKNVRVLVRVQAMANGGLGHAYLEWLLDSLKNETIPAAPMVPDRKTQARAVAEWGYELLGQFCHEVCGYSLPTYDDSLAAKSHADIEETPVIVKAILAALERYDANQQIIATADGDDVYLKPISLVQWVTKNTDIQLPGRSDAVTTWLIQQFGAERMRHPMHGRVLFVPGILKEREEL